MLFEAHTARHAARGDGGLGGGLGGTRDVWAADASDDARLERRPAPGLLSEANMSPSPSVTRERDAIADDTRSAGRVSSSSGLRCSQLALYLCRRRSAYRTVPISQPETRTNHATTQRRNSMNITHERKKHIGGSTMSERTMKAGRSRISPKRMSSTIGKMKVSVRQHPVVSPRYWQVREPFSSSERRRRSA